MAPKERKKKKEWLKLRTEWMTFGVSQGALPGLCGGGSMSNPLVTGMKEEVPSSPQSECASGRVDHVWMWNMFSLTVRRCSSDVHILDCSPSFSVCGMRPTIHHEYTRPVTTASDHEDASEWEVWRIWACGARRGEIQIRWTHLCWIYRFEEARTRTIRERVRSSCDRRFQICARMHVTFNQSDECNLSLANISNRFLNHSFLPVYVLNSGSPRWRKTGE